MSQPRFITDPSYDMLHTAALTLIKEARQFGWIDAVVAPVRGGLFFGVIASHKLNVPLHAVNYSSKIGAGDDKNHDNVLPMGEWGNTILLVDDIIDSGNTMKEITDYYTAKGIKVITAAFHFKEGSVFHPDLYFWRIPSDSEFINYPYEAT